jgi:hypothetical protein
LALHGQSKEWRFDDDCRKTTLSSPSLKMGRRLHVANELRGRVVREFPETLNEVAVWYSEAKKLNTRARRVEKMKRVLSIGKVMS